MGDLLSMTGFGRGEAIAEDLHVVAEIKAVNNRFLEISTKLSPTLTEFELRAKEIVRETIERGRIYLTVTDISPRTKMESIRLNETLTKNLFAHLKSLSERLGFVEDLSFKDMLIFAEQLQQNGYTEAPPMLTELAEKALRMSIDKLSEMRRAEGKALRTDFVERLDNFDDDLRKSAEMVDGNTSQRLEKLRMRLQSIMNMTELDPYRLEMEAVLLADRLDISEEMVRLKSHSEQFRKIILKGSPCGRRLNFLVQEMNRELNTAAAKADLHELSHLVVEMKEELERMREQAQNVE